jgi:single-strand DNA-binding protein
MHRNQNLCEFTGHVGQDLNLKHLASGRAMANFSLGCKSSYKDTEKNWQTKTTWVRCVVFGALAEIMSAHVRKSTYLRIETQYSNRDWFDNEQQKHVEHEFIVKDFEILEANPKKDGQERATAPSLHEPKEAPAASGSAPQATTTTPANKVPATTVFDDDFEDEGNIPF